MGEALDPTKMKVSDLRAALAERNLPTEGLKADLVSRLQARLDEEEFGMDDDIAVPTPASASASVSAVLKKTDIPVKPTEQSEKVTLTQTPKTKQENAVAKVETSTLVEKVNEVGKNGTETVPKNEPTAVADISAMEQKMRARAERFNIPLVVPKQQAKQPQTGGSGKGKNKQDKRERESTSGKESNKKNKKQKSDDKNQADVGRVKPSQSSFKKGVEENKPELLLPKEEIMKRLERAQKFGASNTQQIDALKAMLRRHRFG